LRATFENGTVVEKPSSAYNLYQNLYFHSAKKCLFCGDHFAYEADLSVGDVWIYRLKDDPIKRSGVVVRTEAGRSALRSAADRGAVVLEPVALSEIVDGQARVAPFHYNISARSRVGRSFGMKIPDRLGERVTWHERLVARMAIANQRFSRGKRGGMLMRIPRPLLKAYLYVMKGLESLPVRHGEASAPGRKRFAIIAGTLTGNHGAEAMLTTAIGQVRDRWPDARIDLFSYYPKADRALVSDPGIVVHSSTPKSLVLVLGPGALVLGALSSIGLGGLRGLFPRSVRALARCDALLDVAGVSFIDGREKYLPFNLFTIWPAMWLRVPVVKLAQAMGPFRHPLNRLAAHALRHCALVFARGEGTWDNLQELGMPEGVARRAADVAFLHRDADSITHEGAADVERMLAALDARPKARPIVGVCPSSVIAGKAEKEGWDYPGFLAGIVRGLTDDGCDVLLFPNATRAASEKRRNNDLPVIAQVAAACTDLGDSVRAVDFDVDTSGIKRLVARMDIAMVSRFHAMVGALTLAVPVFVLGWSHKYLEVMEQFDQGGEVFDSSRHDSAEVLAAVRSLRERRDEAAVRIEAKLGGVRASSASQFDALSEVVGG
jgi:polysaccharide pyruvyl transferase WcaK-like protein